MKYFHFGIAISVALLFVLFVTASGQRKDYGDRGKPTEGFQVSGVAESVSIPRGKPVKLKITIKNISPRMLYLAEAGTEKDYKVQVWRDVAKPVPLTTHGKDLENDTDVYMNLSLQLQAGDERTDILEVSKIYEMTTPGTYAIVVTRKVGKLSGKGVEQAASNMVHVKVI